MRKVFLSFLGVTDYLPCNYTYDDQTCKNVRFVQEATISFFCKNWSQDDHIYIFTTQEAEKANWQDNGHKDKNGTPLPSEGLETRINALGLQVPAENVMIPIGVSENEIWEIFQIVFDSLSESDTIIFDITHAFRSIPTLAIVILSYAKVLKNVSLRGIYYGAIEVLGPMYKVKEKGLETGMYRYSILPHSTP